MRQSGVETPVKVGLKLCADGALVAIYAINLGCIKICVATIKTIRYNKLRKLQRA